MNEVRFTQTTAQAPVSSASSTGTVEAKPKLIAKSLPEQEVPSDNTEDAPQVQKASAEELLSKIAKVNDYVQSVQRDLQFSVDEELDKTVVRVVDRDSGELIRQIPEDIFLELARRLKDDGEVNLLNAIG